MPNDFLRLLIIAAVGFLAYSVLVNDSFIKNSGILNLDLASDKPHVPVHNEAGLGQDVKKTIHNQINDIKHNTNVLPNPQISNNYAPQGNFSPSTSHNFAQLDCFPKDQLVATDLLPTEGGFAESNPAAPGQLMNRNLFESGHHAGLNTQSNTLKNANLQLRSDPLIPRRDVGPWSQSTYDGDTNRRPFEIGMA
jgi:hypothetical protein